MNRPAKPGAVPPLRTDFGPPYAEIVHGWGPFYKIVFHPNRALIASDRYTVGLARAEHVANKLIRRKIRKDQPPHIIKTIVGRKQP